VVTKLEARELQINKVMCADFEFHIPGYQRPYAWESEQALELLEDLTQAMENDPDEPYFLGSVVLVKPADHPSCDVIDGQQRLTTLTMLLCVLRELCGNTQLADNIDQLISQPGNLLQKLDAKPRLTLRDRDRTFFQKYVQQAGGLRDLVSEPGPVVANDAQTAIRNNATAFHDRLSEWTDEQRSDLARLIAGRTYLVVVTTPDLTSAHRIFSVMNDRGLDLSPTDNFKARVIGEIPEDDRDLYTSRWEDAEESLGRDAFLTLFAHIRMIFARQRAPRELLKEFPEVVLARYQGRDSEFIDDVLLPYADAYFALLHHSYSAPQGVQTAVNLWLRRLSQLDNVDWQPPALWALKHYATQPAELERLLEKLERLAASMLIRRDGPTTRQQRYGMLLRALEGGQGITATALDLSAAEQAETLLRLDGEIYLQARVRRYVLLRLDEVLADTPGVSYDHKIITVEHVLPQNPASTSQWRRMFDNEQRAYWTHRLANLVLLNRSKNAQAQNFDFSQKKEKYFSGKNGVVAFALTSQVLSTFRWTPDLLHDRQREALDQLASTWDLAPG
jgi:hypothetical protein